MRAPTILCWYISTFLSFHLTSAAPGGRGREGVAVAIDFGAVTEKFPSPLQNPDASQQQQQQQEEEEVVATTKTLQREQKISKSQRPESVRLWIDDFGNIEAVPIISKAGLDDDSSSSPSSSSTEKSAPAPVRGDSASASSGINQPPPSQPPNSPKNHHLATPAQRQQQRQRQRQLQDRRTERAIINWEWKSPFTGFTELLYFVFGGVLLLGGLITLLLSLSTRRRNIRILGMGHRRGRSRFSL